MKYLRISLLTVLSISTLAMAESGWTDLFNGKESDWMAPTLMVLPSIRSWMV